MKRVGAPAPSPDGKWVVSPVTEPAYDEKDQVSDLWIVPADGSAKPRRLTFTKGAEGGVARSPDGGRLAFSTKREGDEAAQIYVMDIAGGEAMRVTSVSTGAVSPRRRPDGQVLLFTSTVPSPVRIARDASTTRGTSTVRRWDRWLARTMGRRFLMTTWEVENWLKK